MKIRNISRAILGILPYSCERSGSGDLPKEQQFAWTLPRWVLSKTMEDWDGQNPEWKKKLEEKYRSGQIIS